MSLTTTILQHLSGGPIHRLASEAGSTSDDVTQAVVLAIPMMLGAAGAHDAHGGKLRSMLDFVAREHGQVLEDLNGYLGHGLAHLTDRQHGPDIGLVGLLFDTHGAHAAELLSNHTALDPLQAMRLLGMLAPVVLSQLTLVQKENRWDEAALAQHVQAEAERAPRMAAEVVKASRDLVATGESRELDEALGSGWWEDALARIQ